MMNIPRDVYLADALSLTRRELSWMHELMLWLPSTIIDAHTHANTRSHFTGIDERNWHHMLSTFPYFDLEESRDLHRRFFPGKKIRSLRFPHAFKGIDHKRANQYLLDECDQDDRVALFGLPDDIQYTIAELKSGRYHALKMYHAYLSPPATEIYEYFPTPVLEAAQRLNIPIILHVPRVLTKCLEDLRRLLLDFPNLTVVLAHLGLTKMVVPGLADAYEEFAQNPHVLLDTSMVPSAEVVSLAIKSFGYQRIVYGSDEPVCLVRAVVYQHPTLGQRLVTSYPYHWVDPKEQASFKHLATDVTHALWPCLQAIRDAIEQLPTDEQDTAKQVIFHDNAARVFRF